MKTTPKVTKQKSKKKQPSGKNTNGTQTSTWYKNFDRMSTIVHDTGALPTCLDPELGHFMHKQRSKFKKEVETGVISNQEKHDIWKKFMEVHPHLFHKQDAWKKDFNKICNDIIADPDKFKEYDSVSSWINNKEKKKELCSIGRWVQTQNDHYEIIKKIIEDNNYANVNNIPADNMIVNIMRDVEIYNIWTTFKNGPIYKKHFMNKIDIWNDNAQKLKLYVDEHKKLPPDPVTVKEAGELKHLATWVASQRRRKPQGTNENVMLYNKWTEFKRVNNC